MKRAALDYVARGWAIFPCYPRSKHPATEHGLLDAVTDRAGVDRLWTRKGYNLAVATGAKSGVWVLDLDGPEAEAALTALEERHSAIPETLTCLTGKGRHLYFRHPGRHIPGRQNWVGPKIDVRGDGSSAILPPSIHPTTRRRYEWVDPGAPIADAPDWLTELVTREREIERRPLAARPGPRDRFEVAEVRRMLDRLDPNMARDEWFRVGMALHAGGYDAELWDEWSRPGRTYSRRAIEANWRSFKDGGVTMGTLVAMAKAAGWEPERRPYVERVTRKVASVIRE